MIHTKTPCSICKSDLIKINLSTQIFMDGSEDTIYEERCRQCGNLLYGWVKKTKEGDPKLIEKIKNANLQNF